MVIGRDNLSGLNERKGVAVRKTAPAALYIEFPGRLQMVDDAGDLARTHPALSGQRGDAREGVSPVSVRVVGDHQHDQQRRAFMFGMLNDPRRGLDAHTLHPFLLLQRQQRVRRFSGSNVPPFDSGMMWSMERCRRERHAAQVKLSRSHISHRRAGGMDALSVCCCRFL